MTTLKTELRGIVTLISVDRRHEDRFTSRSTIASVTASFRRELRAGELAIEPWLARELRDVAAAGAERLRAASRKDILRVVSARHIRCNIAAGAIPARVR